MSGQEARLVFSDAGRALDPPPFNLPAGKAYYFKACYPGFVKFGSYVPALMTHPWRPTRISSSVFWAFASPSAALSSAASRSLGPPAL